MLYYIIAAIIGVIALVIFFIIQGAKSGVKNKKVLVFNFLFAVIITAFGSAGLIKTADNTDVSAWWFFLLQLVFFILGSVFYYLLQKDFFGKLKTTLISQVLLLISNLAFGFVGFSLLFRYFQGKYLGLYYDTSIDLGIYYGMSAFVFVIPYMFMYTFNILASIPPEIHKIWYYPLDAEEPDFDKIDTNNIYLLELELSKSPSDNSIKNYKAKAPVDMLFGEWYRSFINNYNYKYEEDPIRFLDTNQEPHGWMFFTKPQSLWQTKKYIDPDLSIKNNKLTEKTVIIAKRVEVEN